MRACWDILEILRCAGSSAIELIILWLRVELQEIASVRYAVLGSRVLGLTQGNSTRSA